MIIATSSFKTSFANELHAVKTPSGLKDWLSHNGLNMQDAMVLDPQNTPFPVPIDRDVEGYSIRQIQLVNYPITPRWGLSRDIADLRLNVTKAWLSVRDNPALAVDELARERYKRDRITVVQRVSVDNDVRHLITRSTGSEDRRGQHPELSPESD